MYAAENVLIKSGEWGVVPLGFSMAMPGDTCGLIVPRSGLNAAGILSLTGLIDADYRGEVKAVLFNATKREYAVELHHRVGQLIFLPVPEVHWIPVQVLPETLRGTQGFGSSGR